VPYYYCDACKARHDAEYQAKRDLELAKQREYRRRRKQRLEWRRPPTRCVTCDTEFKGRRKDTKFCSQACRQKSYRKRTQSSVTACKQSSRGTVSIRNAKAAA
jgi:hypothetical protein